ncbi:MAG TPA: hypothetical protein VHM19_18580, partial [Polyangiales bacterium]|nr:hypothetical protein [Polyangiales bacterium]
DINFEPAPKANLSIFGASTAPFEDTDARVRRDCGELAIQILWRNGKVLTVCPQITVFMPRFTPDSPGEGRSSGPWPIHFSGHLPQDPDVVAFDLHFRGKRLLHVARHDLRVQARRGTDGSLVIAVSGADASGNSYRTEGRDARMYPVIAGGFPVQPLKEAPCWRLFKNEGHALSIQVADAFSTFSFPLAPRE